MRPIKASDLGLTVLSGGKAVRTGRGAKAKPRMNKLEANYAFVLDLAVKAGQILWWRFEGITLKLADDVRYTPDFAIMEADGMISFHETKGYMRDDARIKLRVAAVMYPFEFYLVQQKDGGAWTVEHVRVA